MMRFCLITIAFLLCLLPASAQQRKFVPSPVFTGTIIPEPPMQIRPWKPQQTDLSQKLVAAAQTLFAEGLADPRGCSYRVVQVGTGDVWMGDDGVATVHGWVLPSNAALRGQFAVCWNGLVYPLVSSGAAADLDADVDAILKADQALAETQKKNDPTGVYQRIEPIQSERQLLSEKTMMPLKACLLLRAGREDLAQRYWAQWSLNATKPTAVNPTTDDPYLTLATDWAWALFDRTLCAHMRGDDNLARLGAHFLKDIQPQIEAEAERHGFPKERTYTLPGRNEFRPYLDFLDPLPTLIADQDRRLTQPKHTPVLTVGLQTLPTKQARIQALIDDLDLVSARQWSQPGGVGLESDAIVAALIGQGEDAVEPLLNSMEHDDRLTRAVQFGRSFHRGRTVLSVSHAAYVALTGIFQMDFFGNYLTEQDSNGKEEVAQRIRAYWLENRGVPLEERWYRTLDDDNAGAVQWMQAANNIVQFDNVKSIPGSFIETTPLAAGEKPKMRGEVLRDKRIPSVADLIAKRVMEIAKHETNPGMRDFAMGDATRMAFNLFAWDPDQALPTLRSLMRLACSYVGAQGSWAGGNSSSVVLSAISRLTIARKDYGDDSAIREYAEWLRNSSPTSFQGYFKEILEPLWHYPDYPILAQTAHLLFEDPTWGWNTFVSKEGDNEVHLLLDTPMLGVSAFRHFVLTRLNDTTELGTVDVLAKQGMIHIHDKQGRDTNFNVDRFDAIAALPGKSTYRICDVCANDLSKIDGASKFELYWPLAKRDQVIADDKALLQRYGVRLKYVEQYGLFWNDPFGDQAHLVFEPLGHPADKEDVTNGQAIFALDDQARTVKMPHYPLKAQWLTYQGDPYLISHYDSETAIPVDRVDYHQDGVVWQAEEIDQAGQTKRFYGFVGPHVITKVPASEIEFPGGRGDTYWWTPLPDGVDAEVTLWHQAGTHHLGDPLPMTLSLRNRRGRAQILATNLIGGGGQASISEGVTLELSYSPPPAAINANVLWDINNLQSIMLKSGIKTTRRVLSKMVQPCDTLTVGEFDLRTFFDISKSGYYSLKISFASPSGVPVGFVRTAPFLLLP